MKYFGYMIWYILDSVQNVWTSANIRYRTPHRPKKGHCWGEMAPDWSNTGTLLLILFQSLGSRSPNDEQSLGDESLMFQLSFRGQLGPVVWHFFGRYTLNPPSMPIENEENEGLGWNPSEKCNDPMVWHQRGYTTKIKSYFWDHEQQPSLKLCYINAHKSTGLRHIPGTNLRSYKTICELTYDLCGGYQAPG